ncbi:MAG: phosphatidylglycerophosphatase A [Campylobacteraceae bacterium]|jgi:phosphatidylglycerophosphatase A|nr:phosphatidylglycerophosphatase A [Campylobacteraceae bacterium]
MQKLFLTFFYSGLFPKAPGTAGTILAAIIAWLFLKVLPISSLFLVCILVSVVAIDVINRFELKSGTHDNSQIVIDEAAGIWIAICCSLSTGVLQILLCVIFFRIFDITKPSYIGRIDRDVKGGLGVMGDDLLAGVVAGIISAGVWQLLSKVEIIQSYNF